MGQNQCCEAQIVNHPNPPHRLINIHNIQEDPLQASGIKISIQTSRSNATKRLGQIQQGQFREAKPSLNAKVSQKIQQLQSIELECYRRLQNQRGVLEPNKFYKFYRTGVVYQGEWYEDKPHGFGKNYYPSGGYYQGTFFKGIPHGFGRFINANGEYYQGDVKFGRGNGIGIYQAGQIRFKGYFKDNVLHGEGEQVGKNYYFKGSYEYGSKKYGIMKYGGNVYEGHFQNDQFQGKGRLTTDQGHYNGNFYQGLQHGYGEFIWKNGSKYRGNYRNGARQGDGEFFNAQNKAIYRGIWKQGILQGQGQYVQPRGERNRVVWEGGKIMSIR